MSCRVQEACIWTDPSDLSLAAQSARIRHLNDAFRTTLTGGSVMLTAGIRELDPNIVAGITTAVRTFDSFDRGNDPFGEHDFGSVLVGTHRALFKIDYYDAALTHASSDPADPSITVRVMTIMLAEEY